MEKHFLVGFKIKLLLGEKQLDYNNIPRKLK